MTEQIHDRDICIEQTVEGKLYRLTQYSTAEWYSMAAAGCPLPSNIVDEFDRVWAEVSL
jgi:hypothetical protein